MKIIPVEQNSLEWLLARSGIPTASEFDALISPLWKIRTGQGVDTYLAQKVAEKWLGGPLPGFQTLDMEFGQIREEEAIPFYEFQFGESIQRVGLVTTDDGRTGCSPDGLIGDDGGIEVKCPEAKTHVKYLLAGVVPADYLAQVHGSMFVTGRKWWKFLSYRRNFPPLVLTVERDDEIQKQIGIALDAFLARLDEAMAEMEKLNGGPPSRRKIEMPKPPPVETFDLPQL